MLIQNAEIFWIIDTAIISCTRKVTVMQKALYEISYRMHAAQRRFIIRTVPLTEATAWHWVACDVGIGIIPPSERDKAPAVPRSTTERFGVSDVTWKRCDDMMLPSSGSAVL